MSEDGHARPMETSFPSGSVTTAGRCPHAAVRVRRRSERRRRRGPTGARGRDDSTGNSSPNTRALPRRCRSGGTACAHLSGSAAAVVARGGTTVPAASRVRGTTASPVAARGRARRGCRGAQGSGESSAPISRSRLSCTRAWCSQRTRSSALGSTARTRAAALHRSHLSCPVRVGDASAACTAAVLRRRPPPGGTADRSRRGLPSTTGSPPVPQGVPGRSAERRRASPRRLRGAPACSSSISVPPERRLRHGRRIRHRDGPLPPRCPSVGLLPASPSTWGLSPIAAVRRAVPGGRRRLRAARSRPALRAPAAAGRRPSGTAAGSAPAPPAARPRRATRAARGCAPPPRRRR
jgi:hypothetical protein